MDLEMAAMQLVGSAGESKSLCFEALRAAKEGDFDLAASKIDEAKKFFYKLMQFKQSLFVKKLTGKR